MKYKIVDTNEVFDDIDDVIEACIEDDYHEDDDYFEEWLDEIYDGVTICGTHYSPYEILSNAGDGNLYDAQRDFCESQNESDRENADWELRHAHVGDTVYVQRYEVEVIDKETEEDDEDITDFDIENLRRIVNEQSVENEEEKENENDIMSLFQHIGG